METPKIHQQYAPLYTPTYLIVNYTRDNVNEIECKCKIYTFLRLFDYDRQQVRSEEAKNKQIRQEQSLHAYPANADTKVHIVSIHPIMDTKLTNLGVNR